MDNRYKIIVSNRKIYQEIELPPGQKALGIGTGLECDCRLRKDYFFEPFELYINKSATAYQITCSDNIYLAAGDDRKLITKELSQRDKLIIKYQRSNQELFCLDFMIDFDYENKDYNREIDISNISKIAIGGYEACHISINDPFLGTDYLTLERSSRGYLVTDNNSRYGVYVNGARIHNRIEIRNYDFLSIVGYSFYLKDHKLCTARKGNITVNGLPNRDLIQNEGAISYPKFNRNTRVKTVIPSDKITILDPPQAPQKPKNNLLKSLIPIIGMIALTVVLRGVMGGGGSFVILSASMMAMGAVTSVVAFFAGNREYKKGTKERIEKYNKYIENKESEIKELREKEETLLNNIYYAVDRELEMVNGFSGDLFDRTENDDDFLHVHLGTGSCPARRTIDYKKQEKLEVSDELAVKPENLSEQYKDLHQVPIVCDFKKSNAIGIIGTDEELYDMLKNTLFDIAIRHYQKDIKTAFIVSEKQSEQFIWIRLLPHIQNELINMRNIACDDDSKNQVMEFMYKLLSEREATKVAKPHYVVFIFDESTIQNHPVSQYIEKARTLGFTFVFFDHHKELLPQGCTYIIQCTKDKTACLIDSANSKKTNFSYVPVSDQAISESVIKIAPIYCEEISLEGSLTKNVSLFELLHIIAPDDLDLQKRWKSSVVHQSMAAPLGVKTKDQIICLDLHEKAHGPHGLVAGTTGSGKSEILQSYILSMATLFHPYEVGFVIIDFKGGGMVNQFIDLPHLIGAITNIDGKEIDRSLQSIKAELQKRQRMFATCGVNHIDAYIKKYKAKEAAEPIPHLIIIVDEFAELKAEQPEFMKELISAARIGRSLGVHLILATQKPSGQVNEQIWSNSRFKLCLKVQNKADSNEVLKSPLAAEIREPGRAYLQVGNNEIFELFQSAYSGAPAQADTRTGRTEFTLNEVSLCGKRTPVFQQKNAKREEGSVTQLKAVVDYVSEYCRFQRIDKLSNICLPPLEEIINFSVTKERVVDFLIPIGIYDDPSNQDQGMAKLDIASENTIIIGSSQTGKTNTIQSIIRTLGMSYSPDEVNIYIMDFGAMTLKAFEKMNHVGGVVVAGEDEKLKNLFKLLKTEIASRKKKLLATEVSSFSSYKEAGYRDLPRILVFIDNFTVFKELYNEEYEEDLILLCREGLTVGISFLITNAQTSGFSYKYLSNFANRLALPCNETSEYSTLFERCRLQPKDTPGRMLIKQQKELYEMQSFLAFEGEKEIDRANAIRAFIDSMNSTYTNTYAKMIPNIPEELTIAYLERNYELNRVPYAYSIGLDYSTVDLVTLDFAAMNELCIIGQDAKHRSSVLAEILDTIHRTVIEQPVRMCIIDSAERFLKAKSEYGYIAKYTIDYSAIGTVLEEITEEMEKRYAILMEGGMEAINDYPLILCMINNRDVMEYMCETKEVMALYKTITKKYKKLKTLFLFSDIDDMSVAYGAPELLKYFKETKKAIVVNNLNDLKFFEIPVGVAKKYKPLKVGDAYYLNGSDLNRIKLVKGI